MDYWSNFMATGNLHSYLKYKEIRDKQKKVVSTKELK